ncbi:hypothetical protein Tdes44962_MAKER07981 [Teratosphaeria destructans]|uniref:Uncharacterized protein n=1 Tax=Teratosphaeria destructans TaxID=418781 RepID=A0A9W7SY81_9PEZI|nr:hypothetical protein Tdes44962_MAKER07981 [Teratosphaeria destructans]
MRSAGPASLPTAAAAAANIRNYMNSARAAADANLNTDNLAGLLHGAKCGDANPVLALAAAKLKKGKAKPVIREIRAAEEQVDMRS